MLGADFFIELVRGGLPLRIQIVALTGSIGVVCVVIYLIRSGQLKEGYSIGWFGVGIAMVVFSLFGRLLAVLANIVGIAYSPAALLLVVISGLLILALHYSVLVSRYDRQIRDLAQDNALLRHDLDELYNVKQDQLAVSSSRVVAQPWRENLQR